MEIELSVGRGSGIRTCGPLLKSENVEQNHIEFRLLVRFPVTLSEVFMSRVGMTMRCNLPRGVGEHGNVAAIDLLGAGVHTFRQDGCSSGRTVGPS